jgi:hypothetical protein
MSTHSKGAQIGAQIAAIEAALQELRRTDGDAVTRVGAAR